MMKSHGGTQDQSRLRPAIAHEMVNEILECPIDDFLDHYAPFSPSQGFINQAFDDLRDHPDQLLEEVGEGADGGWALADFISTSNATESTIFKEFVKIMDVLQVVDYVDGNRHERLFAYKDCPTKNMASEIQGTNFRVDACITSNADANEIVLSHVVAVAEFKTSATSDNIQDNRRKLISAANQIMNDDPQRMWVYGITIEGDQMAVWYFCRSHSVKSKSFSFVMNVKKFICVFLSLLYATRQEIGYDPTVHRVVHKGEICYVYQVGTQEAPRYYRTTELLFTARVLCVTGRKTRVWKAIEVEGPDDGQFREAKSKEHVVLKDGWLDENSRSEKDIQAAVFERLRNIKPSEYQWAPRYLRKRLDDVFRNDKYKEYFMEILDSRRIGKTKPRLASAKPNPDVLSFAEPKPTNSANSLKHLVDGSTQSKDCSGLSFNVPSFTPGTQKENTHPREYKTKEQHRLIYSHVGCALSNAEDLQTSFVAIHDTFIALVLLYLANWTHRDISAGNIIVVGTGASARGKLSDLEYAKEFNDNSFSADPKTGTPYFMAIETHLSKPLYKRKPVLASRMDVDPFARPPQSGKRMLPLNHVQGQAARPLKFRFQHDLESLWWVMIWILLYRFGGVKALELVRRIFTYTIIPTEDRKDFFMESNDDLETHIDKKLLSLTPYLTEIRAILFASYLDRKKTENPLVHSEYADIYGKVWAELSLLIQEVLLFDSVDFQNPPPEPDTTETTEETIKKRPHSKSKSTDDDDYRPSDKKGKIAPTELRTTTPRRAKDAPRRHVN